jgi:hypothetical protein
VLSNTLILGSISQVELRISSIRHEMDYLDQAACIYPKDSQEHSVEKSQKCTYWYIDAITDSSLYAPRRRWLAATK